MTEHSILIVEDELIIAEDLKIQLEAAGYPVVGVVDTGEDAVRYVDSEHPELVLMDIKLAGSMDGIEAAGAIQEQHDVPVVYLTAN
ncbi:MAG: response regulator, partial [Candidatus Neomarinimicrobiota bacterium]